MREQEFSQKPDSLYSAWTEFVFSTLVCWESTSHFALTCTPVTCTPVLPMTLSPPTHFTQFNSKLPTLLDKQLSETAQFLVDIKERSTWHCFYEVSNQKIWKPFFTEDILKISDSVCIFIQFDSLQSSTITYLQHFYTQFQNEHWINLQILDTEESFGKNDKTTFDNLQTWF